MFVVEYIPKHTMTNTKSKVPIAFDYFSLSPELFSKPGNGRENNDDLNKKREIVLETILNISDEKLPEYWKEFKHKWKTCISSLFKGLYDSIQIKKKAGRGNNHDFHVQFLLDTKIVYEVNIEFKHNAKSIDKLPQFLSLPEKILGYASYYYDNYLRLYVETDPGITEPIPEKSIWLLKVYSTNYSVLPFIKQLKDRENVEKKKKNDIVNESISKFLELHATSLDLKWLSDKFKSTQDSKKYILWDLENFNVYDPLQDFETLTYDGIKNKNTILVNCEKTQYSLLLRWRNHKGVLLPAWQISLKSIKI